MECLFFVARLCILPGVGYRECRFCRTPLYCRWETRSVDLAVSDFLGVAMAKFAARLWYQRIPGLIVFGGSSECFLYQGQKAEVYDRRVKSVRRLAQRMFTACRLPSRVVSGIKELLPLKGHVADGIGHYQGTEDARVSLTRALAEFCMLAPMYSGARRSRL